MFYALARFRAAPSLSHMIAKWIAPQSRCGGHIWTPYMYFMPLSSHRAVYTRRWKRPPTGSYVLAGIPPADKQAWGGVLIVFPFLMISTPLQEKRCCKCLTSATPHNVRESTSAGESCDETAGVHTAVPIPKLYLPALSFVCRDHLWEVPSCSRASTRRHLTPVHLVHPLPACPFSGVSGARYPLYNMAWSYSEHIKKTFKEPKLIWTKPLLKQS